MAFTINDLRDLTRLLLERPEWLGEARRMVLTEELFSAGHCLCAALPRRSAALRSGLSSLLRMRFSLISESSGWKSMCQICAAYLLEMLEMRYRDKAPAFFGFWLRKARACAGGD